MLFLSLNTQAHLNINTRKIMELTKQQTQISDFKNFILRFFFFFVGQKDDLKKEKKRKDISHLQAII